MTEHKLSAEVTIRIPNLNRDGIAETHTLRVPVSLDPHTGEEMLTAEAIDRIETAKARYMGLLQPSEIKKLRERLGLTQKQISELLQSGEKSWTRWETGKARPSRMVNVLLRLVYEGKVLVSDLTALRKPNEPRLRTVPKRFPGTQKRKLVSTKLFVKIAMLGCVSIPSIGLGVV